MNDPVGRCCAVPTVPTREWKVICELNQARDHKLASNFIVGSNKCL